MATEKTKNQREKRRQRVRKKVFGTGERPRASVSRSLKHLTVQIVNDAEGKVLTAVSTRQKKFNECWEKKFPGETVRGGNVKAAQVLGEMLVASCREKGIQGIVFDRNRYLYHGRLKALADSARAGGIKF